jgi:pimeloyl-ACP methyl ester carboxylesterase
VAGALGRALPAGVILAVLLAAGARAYAPVDAPGPPLGVPPAQLAAALRCTSAVAGANRAPILLVPGTTLNPRADFSWNWERALSAKQWPYCTVELPGNAMGDIRLAGEYVVYAIRAMHALAGRRIDVVGHSQGGMVPRWALRYWPDTRAMVDDLVGLSPNNHGTLDAVAVCIPDCAPSIWQQRPNAEFMAALNSSQETFPGISYTSVFTLTDEVVVPNFGNTGSSSLHGGGGRIANVAIQQVCPLDVSEHIGIGTYDRTAYELAIDAITHDGPANPGRVSSSVCSNPLMPGVRLLTFATDYAQTLGVVAKTLATYPHVRAEPALAWYVTGAQAAGECASASARPIGRLPHRLRVAKSSRRPRYSRSGEAVIPAGPRHARAAESSNSARAAKYGK